MFLRNKSTTKIEAIIGHTTEVEGSIRANEAIRIDGKIKGSINAESAIVGESGVILGDITANKVTVGGKVKGNISAANMLEILPTGQVLGDIRTSKLVIADGALFEGNCQMLKSDGQVIEINPETFGAENGDGQTSQKHLRVVGVNSKK